MPAELHPQGVALLSALNELFADEWTVTPGEPFYRYSLALETPGRLPFHYMRPIQPKHIHPEVFRTALLFADEVCERYGRFLLLKSEDDDG